jgi:tetratricopeptide (TPR) repeat protein
VAGSENDSTGQRAALQELVAAYPGDERSHNALAGCLFGQQDFTGAIQHFKHAVGINPDYAPSYNLLGYAYRSMDDLDSARSAFETYVSLIPNEPKPYDSYAELLMEMGEYDASIENYRKALQHDAHFGASYGGISTNHSLKGESDMALAAAKEQLAAARTFAERQAALFQSAVAHLFAGDREAAMADCETMLAAAEEAGNHAALGGIHEYMGDISLVAGESANGEEHYASALQHRRQANLNDANRAQAERTHQFKMAVAAIVADDVETASARAAEYTAGAEMHGTTFEKRRIHELAGYLAAVNDDPAGAAEHLAQANQLEPIVLYWSAVANKDAGNTGKAIELAKRAANRNTLSPNLPFFRQEALQLADELGGD